MTRLLAWLAGTLLLLVLAAGGLFLAALESQPLVKRSETLAPLSIAQARGLLLRNDPRRLRPGQAGRMAIPTPSSMTASITRQAASCMAGGLWCCSNAAPKSV